MLVMALAAAKSSLAFQMRMRNPLRVLKNLLGLADWRNVNVGNEERKLFTELNLGPIMEKSGVTEELLAAEDLDGSGDEVYGVSRGESVGLETRAENNLGNLLKEKQELEDELQLIWAIEQRNEAQLGSFVDEEAQWLSMTDEERQLLTRKPFVEECIEALNECLAVYGEEGKP